MLSWSWINCDDSGREQFYLSGHFRSTGKSTGGQWELIIRERGNHSGILWLRWIIRMSVRIITLDDDFKMKDISQRLYKLHETGLCLCCPVWERHVRHVAKIVDCRWCPFVVLLTHVQVPWATSENLIAGTTSGKSWKAAKALWAIFDRRWLMRWGEHLTQAVR